MDTRTRIRLLSAYVMAAIGCVCLPLFAACVFLGLRLPWHMEPLVMVAGLMWPPIAFTVVRKIRREQRS